MAIKMKGLEDLLKEYNVTEGEAFEEKLNKLLPDSWIPKHVYNEDNEKKKMVEKQLSDVNKQLEDLKSKASLSVEQKKQIEELTASHAKEKAEWENTLKATKQGHSLDNALASFKAKNTKAVKALLNQSKLTFADDGKIVGLEEQIKDLQKSDSYLFDNPDTDQQQSYPKFGSTTNNINKNVGSTDSYISQMMAAAGLQN